MKRSFKCSCCNCWYSEKELDHISHSTDEKSNPKQYIKCKNCKDADCVITCKYMPLQSEPLQSEPIKYKPSKEYLEIRKCLNKLRALRF